jgi:uncharacterized protein (TIGR02246 family)
MDEDLRARLEAVESREQIRELPARFVWASARADIPAMMALFTEDCDFETGLPGSRLQLKGRAALAETMTRMIPGPGAILALISNQTVEMHGPDAASGVCVMQNPAAPATVSPFVGYYRDDFRRVNGTWLFSARRFWHYAPQFDPSGS